MFVQGCARQVRGTEAVQWSSAYYDVKTRKRKDAATGLPVAEREKQYKLCAATKGGPQLFAWDAPFFWHIILGWIQFHFDAFTFDAKELSEKNMLVIKSRGRPDSAHGNKVTDSSVGALPKFLVYISVSWLLGVFAFYTHTSCSGGRRNSWGKFKKWFEGVRSQWLQHCQQNGYYNHKKAIETLPSNHTTGEFNPDYFLVCTSDFSHA